MSGGVDSTAAVLLLLEQGYEVTGLTLLLTPEAEGGDGVSAAEKAAETLGIPHRVLDLRDGFRRCVMEKFVSEYCAGRTPNPCIDCNRTMKFGKMLDYALSEGFDYIATGHYARVAYDEKTARLSLLRGADREKDQTYVLYQLSQRELSRLLLPVGEYRKSEIRAIAARAGLQNADRKDSQDICFIPDGDYVRFLREFGKVSPEEGNFVDRDGRVLGRHRGLPAYTIGQRKGLGVSADRRLFVIRKNGEDNTVLLGDDKDLYSSALLASRANFIVSPPPARVTAKTRYSQREAEAALTAEGDFVRVTFDTPQRAVTAGQAVVFYDGETVVGGATIEKAL